PVMEAAPQTGVGQAVLRGVQTTRSWVPCNTNLGTVLLLAPLAAAAAQSWNRTSAGRSPALSDHVPDVLNHLTADDAAHVYEAIRLANPGGLGTVDAADVSAPPPSDLLAAMALAADRD